MSDNVKKRFGLPRSYSFVIRAIISSLFYSQLHARQIFEVTALWNVSALVGFAHATSLGSSPPSMELFGVSDFSAPGWRERLVYRLRAQPRCAPAGREYCCRPPSQRTNARRGASATSRRSASPAPRASPRFSAHPRRPSANERPVFKPIVRGLRTFTIASTALTAAPPTPDG